MKARSAKDLISVYSKTRKYLSKPTHKNTADNFIIGRLFLSKIYMFYNAYDLYHDKKWVRASQSPTTEFGLNFGKLVRYTT